MKRSIFKKPTWSSNSTTQPQTDDDQSDLFRRSGQTYADIIIAKQRRKQEIQARREQERLKTAEEEQSGRKRRKISDGARDYEVGTVERTRSPSAKSEERDGLGSRERWSESSAASHERDMNGILHRSTTSTKSPTPPDTNFRAATVIVDLEDKEDEGLEVVGETSSKPPPPASEHDSDSEDDEFRELRHKAREKARLQKLAASEATPTPEPSQQFSPAGDRLFESSRQTPIAVAPPDPVVQIFITSTIDNTKSLIVQRRLSQPLKDVRVVWCSRQGFSKDMTDSIFLTWRGSRLFDVTSFKSLGIHIDGDGGLVDASRSDVLEARDNRIHLEAMTQDILDAYRKAKNPRRADDEEEEGAIQQQEADKAEEESQLRVTLKSKLKEYADVKVKIRMSTPIERLIFAFRRDHNLGIEKIITLYFEGDSLRPEMTAEECDLEDMVQIDVQIKDAA